MEAGTPSAGRFVGRTEAVEALRRHVAELTDGVGGVTLLVGDTGVGKSTLVAALVDESRRRSVRVLIGRAPPLDDPPPFSLLQSALAHVDDDPLLRADADPTAGAGPTLIGFVPGLNEPDYPTPVGIEWRLRDALGALDARGSRNREQVLTEIADRFLEHSRHGPTILVLEDLHRADRSSLAAVEFFARELAGRPLWILATTPPLATLASVGRARIERFASATQADHVALRPMTSAETAEYLRFTIPGRELSPTEVARRYSESGGNPYLLAQLDHRPARDDEVPSAAAGPAGAASADDREVLDTAAVLGPEFPFALLLGATEIGEERLAEEVDRLVARGLLFERPGEMLEFPQERLREEVYNFLSERRRRTLHRRAGRALEAMGRVDPARVYALARHYYLGREAGKSVEFNRIAAEIAERALAPEAAWEYFSHALEHQREAHPTDRDGEAELVLGLARISEELGVLDQAEEVLREFFARAVDDPTLEVGRRAALEIFLARIRTDRGDLPGAETLAQKVLDTPGLETGSLVRIGALHQLGQVRYYRGDYAGALALHTEEIRLAHAVGIPVVLYRAQIWRIAALAMLGEIRRAIDEARVVTAARDRLGSVRESAQAHLFLGDILADARSPAADRRGAVGEFSEAIRFAERAKDPRRAGWALYKISELLREQGDLAGALEKSELAAHVLGEVGDEVGLSMATKVRGQVAFDRGELDGANGALLDARRRLAGTGHTTEEIDVVLRLAQVAEAQRAPERLRELVAELERLDLPRVRPDLLSEFEAIRRAAAAAG